MYFIRYREMLAAGRSRPWPQTLYRMTGERQMTAGAILEYFAPLQDWLIKYRVQKGYTLGWKRKKVLSSNQVQKGTRKTLFSPTSNSPGERIQPLTNTSVNLTSGAKNESGVVTFPEVKKNDSIDLGKPDLKAALAAMGPALKVTGESSEKSRENSLLDPKSAILGAKPMFVPNKIKDQLDLG